MQYGQIYILDMVFKPYTASTVQDDSIIIEGQVHSKIVLSCL